MKSVFGTKRKQAFFDKKLTAERGFYKMQIKNLTITHKKDLRDMLQNFSLSLNDTDKAALIGEEGNGKSTLLKLLHNPNLIENYAEYTGEIIKNGQRTGYLAQELSEAAKGKSVYQYLCDCPGFFEQSPKELSAIANRLGLKADFFYREQPMGTLSGGEKVKLQLACLFMEKPDIYLLDEPSNDVDLDTLIYLERFIREADIPVLYISHDETLLENTANIIIHMEQIRRKTVPRFTVCKMGYQEYIKNRAYLFERQERLAGEERRAYAKQQDKFLKIQQIVEAQQNTISRQDPHGAALLKKKMQAVQSQKRRFEKEKDDFHEFPDTEEAIFIRFQKAEKIPNGKRLLSYQKEVLTVDGEILAHDIKVELIGPEHVCIVGKNGSGKSTIMKEIAASLLARTDIHAFYMPQNYEDQLPLSLTPVEYLTETGNREEYVKICTFLGSMKFTADEMQHEIRELSGGQKAKLIFLKMTMGKYNVLLLDEPTRNLSPLSNPVVRDMLKEFPGAILSVSHDRKFISEVCGRCIYLEIS